MSYVDAGYTIALVVLALYSLSLLARRRRLERAAGRLVETLPDAPAASGASPRDTVR